MVEEKKTTTEKQSPLHPTLQKKKDARDAKAARKAANKVEEEKSRPNNILLAVLILGGLIGMFVFSAGYNYLSKPETIEEYLKDKGESYSNMQMDDYTVAAITAKGNSMNIDLNATVEAGVMEEYFKEVYSGDNGKEQLEDLAAYFLTSIKPEVQGFSADAKIKLVLNGTEINSAKLTYKDAKKRIKDAEKEDEDDADEDAEAEAEADSEVEVDEDGHVHEDGEEHVHEDGEE